ncbi:hypothetical protein A2U01_0064936, partial [Trifolium medium]|nr:hypothetical protein [Trifolium medium]
MNVTVLLTGTDETGPSRPRGKSATASVRRAKEKALEEAGGRRIYRRVARPQPQPEPIPVVQPQPDPVLAAEEDDGEQLGEADFQEEDAVQQGAAA